MVGIWRIGRIGPIGTAVGRIRQNGIAKNYAFYNRCLNSCLQFKQLFKSGTVSCVSASVCPYC